MKSDEAYLFDILESAKIAIEYLKDKSLYEYEKDLRTQDAIIPIFINSNIQFTSPESSLALLNALIRSITPPDFDN